MGFFPSFIKRSSSKGPTDDFWYNIVSPETSAGVKVSEKEALKYLTVFACVSLIAGDIARLPLILYRKFANGSKERVMDHPLYDILHNAPNLEMTSYNWRESLQGHQLLWGNSYATIDRERLTGNIKALWPLDNPGAVEVKRGKTGRIYYQWRDSNNKRVRKFKREIFHIPGFGFNGLYGLSMITLAREAIGLGLATEKFGARFFGEGTHPSGIVSMPLEVNLGDREKDYKAALKSQWAKLGNSHGLMLLQNGEEYTPLTVPPEDAQFLATRDHQKVEICGMYHVPPHKIALHGQNSNYNNLEQENASYVDSCLMHWIVRWEQAIAQQLLTQEERRSGLFVEFLVDGLLRGDSKARSEYYAKMFNVGAMSPNKILAKENMNPIDGGDQHFVQLNMIPLDQAGTIATVKPEPMPTETKSTRAIEHRQAIVIRDRISTQYRPLIMQAAQDIVNRESIAVKREVSKQLGERANTPMEDWLNDFYNGMPEYIKRKIGPVFRSFAEAITDASIEELGLDPADVDMGNFIDEYIDNYTERHIESSRGQLESLLVEQLEDLEVRVDEWSETRADKIADNETVRESNAVFQTVAFAAGLSTVWRIRGKTCDYCKTLNGKRVRSGQYFFKAGDEVAPGGDNQPMLIRGTTRHPPLHQKCDCYLSVI